MTSYYRCGCLVAYSEFRPKEVVTLRACDKHEYAVMELQGMQAQAQRINELASVVKDRDAR